MIFGENRKLHALVDQQQELLDTQSKLLDKMQKALDDDLVVIERLRDSCDQQKELLDSAMRRIDSQSKLLDKMQKALDDDLVVIARLEDLVRRYEEQMRPKGDTISSHPDNEEDIVATREAAPRQICKFSKGDCR